MVMRIFGLQNNNSGLFEGLLTYRTDKQCVFEATRKIPVQSQEYFDLIHLGVIDIETGVIKPVAPDEQYVLNWEKLNVDDLVDKTPVSHEPPDVQQTKFQERTS